MREPGAAMTGKLRMGRTLRSSGILTLSATLAWVGCATLRTVSDAAGQIARLDAEWLEAAQARDVERVLAFWAEDATVLPPGSPPVVGKAAIREFVAKSFQAPRFRISWKTDRITVSHGGDMAYATGTNRVTFLGPDGNEVSMAGKAVTVWRKESDGVWRCVIDIWNDVGSSP